MDDGGDDDDDAENASLVEFMYVLNIAFQVELSSAIRVSVVVCLL